MEPQRDWDGWRQREERMRFEVLHMLYRASEADPARQVNAWSFAPDLGVWEEEVWNTLVWLEQAGLVRIYRADPLASITLAGVRYVEQEARRRKTIRGISPPKPPSH